MCLIRDSKQKVEDKNMRMWCIESSQQDRIRQQRSIATPRKRTSQVPAPSWSWAALWSADSFSNLSYHCATKLSFQTVLWLYHWLLLSPRKEILAVPAAACASFSVFAGKVAQVSHGSRPVLRRWLQIESRRSRAQTSFGYRQRWCVLKGIWMIQLPCLTEYSVLLVLPQGWAF